MAELDRAPELDWAPELEAATRRLAGVIRPTPVRSHQQLSEQLGTCVVCKDEGAQITPRAPLSPSRRPGPRRDPKSAVMRLVRWRWCRSSVLCFVCLWWCGRARW